MISHTCRSMHVTRGVQRLARLSGLGVRAAAAQHGRWHTLASDLPPAHPHSQDCPPARGFSSKKRAAGVAQAKRAEATSDDEQAAKLEEETAERMRKVIDATKGNFNSVRTGRANPSMLDRIQVEYYGTMTPLNSLAGISVPEARMLVVTPYDKSATKSIEKAIIDSDLGITPQGDAGVIRLTIPQLTKDRRTELAKLVSQLGEEGKVKVRNVRRDILKVISGLEKDKKVSEDEQKALEAAIQKQTDSHVQEIVALVKSKQEDVMKV